MITFIKPKNKKRNETPIKKPENEINQLRSTGANRLVFKALSSENKTNLTGTNSTETKEFFI